MADIIDNGGYGEPIPSYAYTGQRIVAMGGGLRDQIVPMSSEDSTALFVRHMGIVPMGLAANDSVTLEHCPTNDTFGLPEQPVAGGIVAPPGLIPPDQWTAGWDTGSGRTEQQPGIIAPNTTYVPSY